MLEGKQWFRLSTYRDGPALVVGACTYWMEWFAAQSGSDFERSYVEVREIRVDAGNASVELVFEYEEQFPENGAPSDEPWARQICAQHLAHAIAERRIKARCEAAIASQTVAWGPK